MERPYSEVFPKKEKNFNSSIKNLDKTSVAEGIG
jgi:hypothetical protein